MTRTGWGLTTALVVGALLLAGCGDPNKGSADGAKFERALRAEQADALEDVAIHAENALPWAGSFDAVVTVRPDASGEALASVEESVHRLLGDGDEAEVWANGVELCNTPHRQLREQLRAAGTALVGELSCERYAGTLVDASADIAVVRAAVVADPGLGDLAVDGLVSKPEGTMTGRWRDLPEQLAPTVGVVPARDLNRFTVRGRELTLWVQPGTDVAGLQRTAALAAPNATVTVQVGPGTQGTENYPMQAAEVRTRVQALPNVRSARFVAPGSVVVRVAAESQVAPAVVASLPIASAIDGLQVHVTTQAADHPLWTVEHGADFEVTEGSDLAQLPAFEALVASGRFGSVGWREPSARTRQRMVTITAPSGGRLSEVLPIIKEQVPDGTSLNLHLGDKDFFLDAAPRLDPDDGLVRKLPTVFVETWNALP